MISLEKVDSEKYNRLAAARDVQQSFWEVQDILNKNTEEVIMNHKELFPDHIRVKLLDVFGRLSNLSCYFYDV